VGEEKPVENSSPDAQLADATKSYCAKLLFKIALQTFRSAHASLQTESGTLTFTRRGGIFFLGLVGLSNLAVFASAQQASSGAAVQSVPAGVSAAQPVPDASTVMQAAPVSSSKVDPDKANSGESTTVRLGTGDLIEVNVYNVPELTTKARIGNSGDVYLPLIDYVHVEGLTQEEAQSLIEKRLADGGFVRSPHVTILVDEAASQGVTVLGEVVKPGIYPDGANHKLYEVLSEAGGFNPSASHKVAIIRRDQPEPIRVDLPRNLADDVSGNVEILPGDTITVQRAPIIYVVGDVGRPSGLLVDNGTLTVLQALALAGGTNHTAKLSGARIIRKGSAGMTEVKVEIKKMLEAKSPDVTLQADDILFIPLSAGRVAAARTYEAAMSMATMVGIYAVHP